MKKKKFLFILSLILESFIAPTFVLLTLFRVVNFIVLIIAVSVDVLLILVTAVMFAKWLKKQKILLKNKQEKLTGDMLIDIYAILGIPVQYNEDGSIKSIYELLEIFPIYDETGTRLLTPYEVLGLMPQFDSNGKEIPLIFVIKNKVGSIARVDLTQRILTRKLSEEELMQKMIDEALRKRLEEAEKTGDKKQADIIKKAISANAKPTKKPAKKTPTVKHTYSSKPEKIYRKDNSGVTLDFFKPIKPVKKPSAPAPAPAPAPSPAPQEPQRVTLALRGVLTDNKTVEKAQPKRINRKVPSLTGVEVGHKRTLVAGVEPEDTH